MFVSFVVGVPVLSLFVGSDVNKDGVLLLGLDEGLVVSCGKVGRVLGLLVL